MSIESLSGRVVLITGAARGIGYATAECFLQRGARVAICDIDEQACASAAERLSALGEVKSYRLDVRDRAAFTDVVDHVEADLGPLAVLVNNAGIMPIGDFEDVPDDVDERQIDINLWGVINGMKVVIPRFKDRREGHVVNIASAAGRLPTPYIATYAATKFAVVGLTESVRYEHEETGLGFSYVMPALVDTDLVSGTGRPRFPPVVPPSAVGRAVVRAVEENLVDVYVPRMLRITAAIPIFTPRSFYERLGKWFKLAEMFKHTDEGRTSYRDRIRAL